MKIYLQSQYFIFVQLLVIFTQSTTGESWSYDDLGPDVWSDIYSLCAGQSQSPINIKTIHTTYQSWAPFHFPSAFNITPNFTLMNNGYTIIGTYNSNDLSLFELIGGGLQETSKAHRRIRS